MWEKFWGEVVREFGVSVGSVLRCGRVYGVSVEGIKKSVEKCVGVWKDVRKEIAECVGRDTG